MRRTAGSGWMRALALAVLAAGVTGCGGGGGAPPEGSSGQEAAFVIATDFETGSFGTVGLDAARAVVTAGPSRRVHGDAVARVHGGLVYVVNRFAGDNIQVIDPADGFATRRQCSTGNGSNPHDIALLNSTKAYVTLSDQSSLLVVNPSADCRDFVRDSIDLSAFADDDGLPEMDLMAVVGGRLYVSLQRLDRRNFFAAAGPGMVAVIDTATDTVVGSITLSGGNPFAQTKGLTVRSGRLVTAEAGRFGVSDGGIETVDIPAGPARGFFVSESDLGGEISDFVLVSDRLGYAVVSKADFTNALVAFDPTTRAVVRSLVSGSTYISDIELNDRGELFVADRNATRPGVRIFRAADGAELTSAPLDLGLPPFDIVFIE